MTLLYKISHFFCADLEEVGAKKLTSEDIISRMAKDSNSLQKYDAPYALIVGKILSNNENLNKSKKNLIHRRFDDYKD